MDNVISRQSALNALRTCYDTETITMDNGDEYINYGDAVGEIEQLPSAQTERPKGKWEPHIERSREYIGTVLVNVRYDYWLCDTCGYRVKKGQPTYNFCPNCGADMRGEQNE